jgi:hypothetical protein
MVKLLLKNNCNAPVLLRNFLESETTPGAAAGDGGGGGGNQLSAAVAHAELP